MPLVAASCRTPLEHAPSRVVAVGAPLPEPGPPAAAGARAAFFQGLTQVERPLAALRARPTPPGTPPALVRLSGLEDAVRARFARGTAAGAVREPLAVGVSCWFPLPPRQAADLVMDPNVERHAFSANTFQVVGTAFALPGASRQRVHVEMLDQGEGPVRFDFRFAFMAERLELADGTILLRYDPAPWARTENVTLFRGFGVIEPSGAGALVTEVVIFGSDVSVPFFLRGALRDMSYNSFEVRMRRIWSIATRRR